MNGRISDAQRDMLDAVEEGDTWALEEARERTQALIDQIGQEEGDT